MNPSPKQAATVVHRIGVDCGVFGGDASAEWSDVTCKACLVVRDEDAKALALALEELSK